MKLNDHGIEQLSKTISSLIALKELDLEFVKYFDLKNVFDQK